LHSRHYPHCCTASASSFPIDALNTSWTFPLICGGRRSNNSRFQPENSPTGLSLLRIDETYCALWTMLTMTDDLAAAQIKTSLMLISSGPAKKKASPLAQESFTLVSCQDPQKASTSRRWTAVPLRKLLQRLPYSPSELRCVFNTADLIASYKLGSPWKHRKFMIAVEMRLSGSGDYMPFAWREFPNRTSKWNLQTHLMLTVGIRIVARPCGTAE
jgi:hypothetical protein